MWGSLWALPKVESSARTCALLSQINAAGQLQWQFTSGFDLRNSLWLPFTVRTRFIRFPQGTMGPFQLGDNNPFQTLMELLGMSKVDSSAHICDSPSNLYVVGQLQWWFTCGFNFRHSLWLSFVSASTLVKVIIIVPGEPLPDFGGGCGVCPKPRGGRTLTPHLQRFMLPVSFSDSLFVVLI